LDIEVKKKPNAAPVPDQEIRDEDGHWPPFTEKWGGGGVVRNEIVSVFLK
jgi:hypothetical protein